MAVLSSTRAMEVINTARAAAGRPALCEAEKGLMRLLFQEHPALVFDLHRLGAVVDLDSGKIYKED